MIEIEENELQDLLIYAFRYALPRHTYATGDLVHYLFKFERCLNKYDKANICREIVKFLDSGDCWDTDRPGWEDVLERFKENNEKENKTLD